MEWNYLLTPTSYFNGALAWFIIFISNGCIGSSAVIITFLTAQVSQEVSTHSREYLFRVHSMV